MVQKVLELLESNPTLFLDVLHDLDALEITFFKELFEVFEDDGAEFWKEVISGVCFLPHHSPPVPIVSFLHSLCLHILCLLLSCLSFSASFFPLGLLVVRAG
jgi:hypothetical protein